MSAESHDEWHDRFGNEARKGCDILVQALEREQVRTVFAYPGGCSMEIHQALTRSPIIRNILCRHEQVGLPENASCSTIHSLELMRVFVVNQSSCGGKSDEKSLSTRALGVLPTLHEPCNTRETFLQGEIFAAEGYAKVTGEVGVCIATSGPGATNLVTGLADALLDSVPMVAITGQVEDNLPYDIQPHFVKCWPLGFWNFGADPNFFFLLRAMLAQ